jgi:hypothetical protein
MPKEFSLRLVLPESELAIDIRERSERVLESWKAFKDMRKG